MKKIILMLLFTCINLFSQEVDMKLTKNSSKENEKIINIEDLKDYKELESIDNNREISENKIENEVAINENISNLTKSNFSRIENPNKIELIPNKTYKSEAIALSLSFIPGLGQLYLGDYKSAISLFSTAALSFTAAIYSDKLSPYASHSFSSAIFYSIYSTYRDVRFRNDNLGYKYKIPNEQFDELSKSPFNYKVLKKKEVWGGTLALLAGGIGVSYLRDKLTNKIDIKKSLKVSSKYAYPIVAFPIGFSEEILFRGFLQPSLNEILTPTGGVIASSLIFGAAHLSNASNWSNRDRINYYRFSIPYITLAGAYFGYISYKNNSLKEAIAVHSWYDFVLFALNSIDFGSTIVKRPSFSFGFSF